MLHVCDQHFRHTGSHNNDAVFGSRRFVANDTCRTFVGAKLCHICRVGGCWVREHQSSDRQTETDRQTIRQTDRQTDRHDITRQANGQTDMCRQADRQTDRDRQTWAAVDSQTVTASDDLNQNYPRTDRDVRSQQTNKRLTRDLQKCMEKFDTQKALVDRSAIMSVVSAYVLCCVCAQIFFVVLAHYA